MAREEISREMVGHFENRVQDVAVKLRLLGKRLETGDLDTFEAPVRTLIGAIERLEKYASGLETAFERECEQQAKRREIEAMRKKKA